MFADLLQLMARRPRAGYERDFVRSVSVRHRSPRNPRVERVLVLGWALIALKTAVLVWALPHYHVLLPFNVLWVVAPTIVFGALCTVVYLLRD
jgi:hypothetical protein